MRGACVPPRRHKQYADRSFDIRKELGGMQISFQAPSHKINGKPRCFQLLLHRGR